jgi:hypothetical protein
MPEPSPTDWAAPDSLAAVLTPGQAVAVLPVVKSWENMLTRRHDRFDVRPAGRAGGLGGCGGLRCQPAESTVWAG